MVEYITTKEKYNLVVDGIQDYCARIAVLQVDTETTGLDPHTSELLLLQLGGMKNQYVFNFPILNSLGVDWTPIEKALENENITKILHNAKFDYKVLLSAMGIRMKNMRDTMIATHLIRAGLQKKGAGLDNLLDEYNLAKKDKSVRTGFIEHVGVDFTPEEIEYAAMDVRHLHDLHEILMRDVEDLGLVDVYNIECAAISGTAEMEYNGVFLDYALWSPLEASAKKIRLEKKEVLDKLMVPYMGANLFGEALINYSSPVQLKPALERVLGHSIANTKEEIIEQYVDNEIVAALINFRKAEKRITTYGSRFYYENVNPITGRVHCSFKQTGSTDSGRYSSTKPNMQNIPRNKLYRAAFRVQFPGWKIVGADYSSMELRLLAEFSEDPAFSDIFLKDLDPHCHVSSMIFRKPIRKKGAKYIALDGSVKIAEEDIDIHLRPVGKNINFGVAYGQGPKRLANTLTAEGAPTTTPQAKGILNQFWTVFPNVKIFLLSRVKQALKDNCVRCVMDNRLRWLTTMNLRVAKYKAHASNIAKNMSLQSGNATIIKKAIALLMQAIADRGWTEICKLILTVHDELVLECKTEIAEEVREMLETCMLNAAYRYVHSIPMKVDSYIEDYWKK